MIILTYISVLFIIKKNFNNNKINRLFDGHAALHIAAQNGNIDVIRFLAKHNAYLELEV